MDWKDLNVRKYYEVIKIMNESTDDITLTTELVDCIFDVKSEDLPYLQLMNLVNQLDFLAKRYEPQIPKKRYVIEDMTFIPSLDIKNITTAQYIDYQNLYKIQDWKNLLNCLLIRENEKYGDNDYSDILWEKLSFTDYSDILFFFLKLWKILMINTLTSSKKALKKQYRAEKNPQKKEELLKTMGQIQLTIMSLGEADEFE